MISSKSPVIDDSNKTKQTTVEQFKEILNIFKVSMKKETAEEIEKLWSELILKKEGIKSDDVNQVLKRYQELIFIFLDKNNARWSISCLCKYKKKVEQYLTKNKSFEVVDERDEVIQDHIKERYEKNNAMNT